MQSNNKEKILFYGTPEFAVTVLKHLIEEGYNIVGVVTMPDKPQGRGKRIQASPVKEFALSHKIRIYQPTNLKSDEFRETLDAVNPSVQVVVAFRMLPEMVWNKPPLGTFNVHASLLPQYRGAAPINWVLLNGEKETGCTTFKLKHEIDTGDLAFQESLSINSEDDFGSLYSRLSVLGGSLMAKTLRALYSGTLKLRRQELDETDVKNAPKITKDDLIIRTGTIDETHNRVRAFSPYPGAKLLGKDNSFIKIFKTTKLKDDLNGELIGEVNKNSAFDLELIITKKQLLINCSDGYLRIDELQLPGKRKMSAADVINGSFLNN